MGKRNLLIIIIAMGAVTAGLMAWFLMGTQSFAALIPGARGPIVREEFDFAIYGSKKMPLRNPMAVAVASDGKIYVADSDAHMIQVFYSNGKPAFQFGGFGAAPGQLGAPVSLAISGELLYISEINNRRVQIFDLSGKYLGPFPAKAEELVMPTALAVDTEGKVYVVDKATQEIKVFHPDGQLVARWGRAGSQAGEFQFPMGLVIDGEQKLIVADSNNNRLQILDSKGQVIQLIDKDPEGAPILAVPRGVAVGRWGQIYVANSLRHQINRLNSLGVLEKTIGEMGQDDEQLYFPNGLTYYDGKLYIADKGNRRVVVYQVD